MDIVPVRLKNAVLRVLGRSTHVNFRQVYIPQQQLAGALPNQACGRTEGLMVHYVLSQREAARRDAEALKLCTSY